MNFGRAVAVAGIGFTHSFWRLPVLITNNVIPGSFIIWGLRSTD